MVAPVLSMKIVESQAPVQISGTVDGVPFYFRARWASWEFGAGSDPVEVVVDEGVHGGFYRTGSYDPAGDGFGASYMNLRVAKQIVRRCADELRRTQGNGR
jgi:hypothetical protein